MKNMNLRALLVTFASILLSACGGGGGGDSGPTTSTESFPLKSAWANYVTRNISQPFTMTGTVSGVTVSGSGTITRGSLEASTFEGAPALRKVSTMTATLSGGGTTIPISLTTMDFVDSSYLPLGSSGSEYSVVTSPSTIPDMAKVGDTGIWYTETRYPNSLKVYSIGTNTVSYALEPETANTARLRIISTTRDTVGATIGNSTLTLRIDAAGAITWISESAVTSDGVLNAYY